MAIWWATEAIPVPVTAFMVIMAFMGITACMDIKVAVHLVARHLVARVAAAATVVCTVIRAEKKTRETP